MLGLMCPNLLDVFIIFSLGKLGLCVCLIPKYQSGELPKGCTLENWLCKDLFTYRKIYPHLESSGLSLTVYTLCNCHPHLFLSRVLLGLFVSQSPFQPQPQETHSCVSFMEHTQHTVFPPFLSLLPSLSFFSLLPFHALLSAPPPTHLLDRI